MLLSLHPLLFQAIPVLDHGFVRVVDYMGDDAAIVQAARVSYGAGTKHVQNDEGLIRYLMRHWHSTPWPCHRANRITPWTHASSPRWWPSSSNA